MRITLRLASTVAFVAAMAAPALAGVDVSFIDPEHFTDIKQREFTTTDADRQRILDDLRSHIEGLGARLQPLQTVTVEVLDIDLAGKVDPVPLKQDLRTAPEFAAPRIKLRYVFEEGGQVIASAEEWVSDDNYLNHPTLRTNSDPLRYEKYMLDNWFEQRFVRR